MTVVALTTCTHVYISHVMVSIEKNADSGDTTTHSLTILGYPTFGYPTFVSGGSVNTRLAGVNTKHFNSYVNHEFFYIGSFLRILRNRVLFYFAAFIYSYQSPVLFQLYKCILHNFISVLNMFEDLYAIGKYTKI